MPATRNDNRDVDRASPRAAGMGAVVLTLSVATESPLPELNCVGLKAQVVSGGRLEQVSVTSSGNAPVFARHRRCRELLVQHSLKAGLR
jgi:hypothetical protein